MSENEIVDALFGLNPGPEWVVFSGGNPALLELGDLVTRLQRHYEIMVETQGSEWKDWLAQVDELCISPKPPSAKTDAVDVAPFLNSLLYARSIPSDQAYLKVVIFTDEDYEWARNLHLTYPEMDFFLSVGHSDPSMPTVGNPYPTTEVEPGFQKRRYLSQMRKLFEKISNDQTMADVRVLPQMHILAWGNEKGR